MLLSTDMSSYDESAFKQERVFLDGSVDLALSGNQVAIQSFDETCNSALGRMLEQVTGIFTGSDANIYQAFDKAIGCGNLGELHSSDEGRVWFTKTNHPMESKPRTFQAQKMICVVRNPSDIIRQSADSKNLFAMQDRLKFVGDYDRSHQDWWNKWVPLQTENIAECHQYIMERVVNQIPIYFVRYEDLQKNPAPILKNVFKLALGVSSL